MSFTDPQPGDKDPRDRPRPGDSDELRGLHGPDDIAGDRASHDRASAADLEKSDEPLAGPGEVNTVHFSAPFIKRPVATFLLSLAIIIAGAVAYRLLPVSSLPEVEYPVISVGASLPGADPETMASAVATPLERQFARIAGVNEMTSTSGTGSTSVILQFDLNRDINGAARDVQAAINAARAQLPANMPSNPTYRKINPSDSPILILALTSDTVTKSQMYDASDSILAQKIAQVDGVGQVFTGGSASPAVRVEVNPYLLTAKGLSLEDLRSAIGTFNVMQPTGYINGPNSRMSLSTTDQLFGAAAYAPLIIATSKGPVSNASAATGLPKSLASAVTSTTSTSGSSTGATTSNASTGNAASSANASGTSTNSTPNSGVTNFATSQRHHCRRPPMPRATSVSVTSLRSSTPSLTSTPAAPSTASLPSSSLSSRRPVPTSSRPSTTCSRILPQLQASISPAINIQVVLDRTGTIRASVNDITRTLIISILLVILVVFRLPARRPHDPHPVCLRSALAARHLRRDVPARLHARQSLAHGARHLHRLRRRRRDRRHREHHPPPRRGSTVPSTPPCSAPRRSASPSSPCPPRSSPSSFPFCSWAASSVVSSASSPSRSPSPSACRWSSRSPPRRCCAGKFLKPLSQVSKGWFYRTGEKHLKRLTVEYERGLRWVIRHQVTTFIVFLVTFALNIYLFIIVPKGFFPLQDTGRLGGSLQTQQDASFLRTRESMTRIAADCSKGSRRRKCARLPWWRRSGRRRLQPRPHVRHPQAHR